MANPYFWGMYFRGSLDVSRRPIDGILREGKRHLQFTYSLCRGNKPRGTSRHSLSQQVKYAIDFLCNQVGLVWGLLTVLWMQVEHKFIGICSEYIQPFFPVFIFSLPFSPTHSIRWNELAMVIELQRWGCVAMPRKDCFQSNHSILLGKWEGME